MSLDTTSHRRRVAEDRRSPGYRSEYDRARREIDQVDAIVRALDSRRQELGWTKADVARAVGKNPASVRRLFSSAGNPQLKMVAAIAVALGGEIRPVFPREGGVVSPAMGSNLKQAAP